MIATEPVTGIDLGDTERLLKLSGFVGIKPQTPFNRYGSTAESND